jgi:cysteinyl-tRNA synthetase
VLEDDFNTPDALALFHEWRSRGDAASLRWGLDLFGLGSLAAGAGEPPAEVVSLAERRARARGEQNWAEADRLRDEIEAAGWEVRDVADAPGFRLVPRG